MARLFVGVDLPAVVKDELASVAETLGETIEARWVSRDNFHVTLRFLGRVDAARVSEISGAIADAVAGMAGVPTGLDALGAFPSARRARVVWADLADPTGGLTVLADAVGEALAAIGFAREERAFRAHVTLARLNPPRAVSFDAGIQPLRFIVDRVTLFESHLSRSGARYEAVATFPFGPRPRARRDG